MNVLEYKDNSGKTPSDYLCDLLDSDVNVIRLAAYVHRAFESKSSLHGKCLGAIRNPYIQIWVHSQTPYHLMYSFFRDRNELCFLHVFNGDNPEEELAEGTRRIRNLYQIF